MDSHKHNHKYINEYTNIQAI